MQHHVRRIRRGKNDILSLSINTLRIVRPTDRERNDYTIHLDSLARAGSFVLTLERANSKRAGESLNKNGVLKPCKRTCRQQNTGI